MLIDWFTVGAQILNFLVLVWLLKRFLYKPILKAIDERENRIAAELREADAKKLQATQERDDYRNKNRDFDLQRNALMSQAKQAAQDERQCMLTQARKEADILRDTRQEALKREETSLKAEFSRRAQVEVMAIARKTLTDLAGVSLEDRIFEVFIERLKELDVKTECFDVRSVDSTELVLIRSAFEICEKRRSLIEQTVRKTCVCEDPIHFELAPNLICGMELIMQGRKIVWSVGDYLRSLESCIDAQLQSQQLASEPKNRAVEDCSHVVVKSQLNADCS